MEWALVSLFLFTVFVLINSTDDVSDLNTKWENFKDLQRRQYEMFHERVQKRRTQRCRVSFGRFQETHNKSFLYQFFEKRRRRNWEKNIKHINSHNAEAEKGLHSYTLHSNHLSDLTSSEYLRQMVKLLKSRRRRLAKDMVEASQPHHHGNISEEINWIEKGFKTQMWNQGDCGACYAFSVVNSIEGQLFKNSGSHVDLSKQQVVDCSIKVGNLGCQGGSLRNSLRYLETSGGLMTAKDYPYIGKQEKCHFNSKRAVVNITSWAILPPRDENSLQFAVANIGPVAASIDASPAHFQLYHSGIYDDPSCSSDTVNHAVLVVGYTKEAWIIKNWWSDKWGENGYMRLARNKNLCGIANYAAYPIIG